MNAVQCFQQDNAVKESLHNFGMQQDEALHNMGYHPFYLSLLRKLGGLETMGEYFSMMTGVIEVNNAKKTNERRKQKPKVK